MVVGHLLAMGLTSTPGLTSFAPLWFILISISTLIMNAMHRVHQSPRSPQRYPLHNPPCVSTGLLAPCGGVCGGEWGLK